MKKKQILLLLSVFLCVTSCESNRSVELSRYHEDGRAKPKVVFMPVIDSTESTLPWSLAQEFTEGIQNRFVSHSNLFLLHDYITTGQKQPTNPFAEENAGLRELNKSAEFVVFVELSEHTLVPKISESLFNISNNPSYHLEMSIRVKVVDMRHEVPKTILQEMFSETYTIPWQLSGIDYSKTSWGKTGFFISPMGLAHAGVIKKISGQIEDYILLAQTR